MAIQAYYKLKNTSFKVLLPGLASVARPGQGGYCLSEASRMFLRIQRYSSLMAVTRKS